ncbi:hypothetical protein NDU88_000482 [Pleurodeles waltl]|uniref:Uncharacterized protein n=1 Tax=Pleurodeles waltl TaxID=8319 RepID=A0AAV7VWN2_PLEWA|nr:hypothetical protein NDU88_000482 [Pleurodeles waltl]
MLVRPHANIGHQRRAISGTCQPALRRCRLIRSPQYGRRVTAMWKRDGGLKNRSLLRDCVGPNSWACGSISPLPLGPGE